MKRRTARLINSIGYRKRLAEGLPEMEARLLAALDEGEELRTRRWVVRRQSHELQIIPSNVTQRYQCLPLPLVKSSQEACRPKGI